MHIKSTIWESHVISSNRFIVILSTEITDKPTPLTPCKNEADDCDGIYDALGGCVCGAEIRTIAFVGTYSDQNCTELVEKLPRPKLPTEACFNLNAYFWKSLFAPHLFSLKVTCLKNEAGVNIGANFQLWDGKNCDPDDFVAEANVYPGQCAYGGLETYMRGKDIWVYDDTCTDE